MTTKDTPKSWRDVVKVHPAADVFPRMSQAELKVLGEDIAKNGLQVRVIIGLDPETGEEVLLDGRNRLDAMELVNESVLKNGKLTPYVKSGALISGFDPAAIVIAANIRRRHLSKAQQAKLIVAAVKAGRNNDSAKIARSFNPKAGKCGGSTKDPVTEQTITLAAKEGISERTARSALAAEKHAEIEQLIREGVSRDEIMKRVHCNPNTIAKVRKSMKDAPAAATPSNVVPIRTPSPRRNEDKWAKGTLDEISERSPDQLTDPEFFGQELLNHSRRFLGAKRKAVQS